MLTPLAAVFYYVYPSSLEEDRHAEEQTFRRCCGQCFCGAGGWYLRQMHLLHPLHHTLSRQMSVLYLTIPSAVSARRWGIRRSGRIRLLAHQRRLSRHLGFQCQRYTVYRRQPGMGSLRRLGQDLGRLGCECGRAVLRLSGRQTPQWRQQGLHVCRAECDLTPIRACTRCRRRAASRSISAKARSFFLSVSKTF